MVNKSNRDDPLNLYVAIVKSHERFMPSNAERKKNYSNIKISHHQDKDLSDTSSSTKWMGPLADFHFVISITDCESEEEKGSLSTTIHILYSITVLKLEDGENHTVRKRFKEVYDFYTELQTTGDIKDPPSIEFPSRYTNTWFSSDKNDPNSTFNKKRKADLQTFLKSMFTRNSHLWHHSKTIQFLELHLFKDY